MPSVDTNSCFPEIAEFAELSLVAGPATGKRDEDREGMLHDTKGLRRASIRVAGSTAACMEAGRSGRASCPLARSIHVNIALQYLYYPS